MADRVVKKQIKYLNKEFSTLRNALVEFAKVYYPQTYTNFNETSVGMMLMEMSSYVGDVLSYYIDDSLKEALLIHADEQKNVYALAQSLGYRPALSFPATVELEVMQQVPSAGSGINIGPDWNYALTIEENMQVASEEDSTVIFRTVEPVDFKHSSSFDPTEVSVFSLDNSNIPAFYLLKKKVKAVAGEIKEIDVVFNDAERFKTVELPDENVIEIIDATDSDGNKWYHVPYLAQETIFTQVENVAANDPELSQYNETAPYLLKLIKTARRFTSRILGNGKIQIQFGSGISSNPDELIIPNPANVGSNLFGAITFSDNPVDPGNFLFTNTYGQVPANTTLTIRYTVGGGIASNVNQRTLRNIRGITTNLDESGLDSDLVTTVNDSVASDNPCAANGGRDGETVEEIRHNALANFPTQLRAVTKEDYIVRAYSMPARFGSVAKSYVVQDDQLNSADVSTNTTMATGSAMLRPTGIPNPLALNMYVLGYNNQRQLTVLNDAVKENLKTYLGQYRMLTDAINILNGWIVDIGVNFTIISFKNYNKREVVLRCIDRLKDFFNVDKWQFNQPIVLSEIQRELFSVEGVQSVVSCEIVNKYDTNAGYSGNIYNIDAATRDGIIYPSIDPMCWQVKFPNTDIQGRSL